MVSKMWSSPTFWLRLAMFNFLIVGLLGLVMRFKMILPMPWVNQKFLLHSHSHFAFSGWVTHALMVLVLAVISREAGLATQARRLILANLVTAYGMLFTFIWQGYAFFSITFSTLSILVSYWFAGFVWKALKTSPGEGWTRLTSKWIRGALVLLVFSSLGTFVLSYLMATNNVDSRKQLAAVYFYLHFQYNGWFLFACLGLLHQWLHRHGVILKRTGMLFSVFALAVVPTYFLSVLWWKMPAWLYALVVIAALGQLVAWVAWSAEWWRKASAMRLFSSPLVRFMLVVVALAFTIKLLLQAFSLHPDLSQLAYGYRPIVIGYLHLILLMVISLFIWAYAMGNGVLVENSRVRMGAYLAIGGIVLNELLLMTQGLSGLFRVYVPYTAQALAGASILICLGIFLGLWGQRSQKDNG